MSFVTLTIHKCNDGLCSKIAYNQHEIVFKCVLLFVLACACAYMQDSHISGKVSRISLSIEKNLIELTCNCITFVLTVILLLMTMMTILMMTSMLLLLRLLLPMMISNVHCIINTCMVYIHLVTFKQCHSKQKVVLSSSFATSSTMV